jgi:hypothetical protein
MTQARAHARRILPCKLNSDWKVALEKELKDQGVAPLSKTGLAAMQRARYANRSVEQKTADNVREAVTQKLFKGLEGGRGQAALRAAANRESDSSSSSSEESSARSSSSFY